MGEFSTIYRKIPDFCSDTNHSQNLKQSRPELCKGEYTPGKMGSPLPLSAPEIKDLRK
jgi:hypothetical protein